METVARLFIRRPQNTQSKWIFPNGRLSFSCMAPASSERTARCGLIARLAPPAIYRIQRASPKSRGYTQIRYHTSVCRSDDLTRRCSQPLHRVQPQFPMINTRLLQLNLAAISGG